MNRYFISLILVLSLFSCSTGTNIRRDISQDDKVYSYEHFSRIDFRKVLFGIEYSFQDEEIVREPGRMTMRTEHKGQKFDDMFAAYSTQLGISKDAIVQDTAFGSFKPGYVFSVPGDGNYTINMEPVTIEVNTTPKLIEQIIPTSSKIFAAADQASLVPYVNPAAERSGMGHIHVGARTLRESPLYQHPNLLRNILVYYHKHPSLMYGFAEAYDIGSNSNIETFHDPVRQDLFEKIIADFDHWYLDAVKNGGDLSEGLSHMLKAIKRHNPSGNIFCHHYRVVNLEHLCKLNPDDLPLDIEGKFTAEHRSFRPQKNAHTAHANAHLLLDLYERLSLPGYLTPFKKISASEFQRYWTGSVLKADWQEVKSFINHQNPYSDAMIDETVAALTQQVEQPSRVIPGAKIVAAFSQKEFKGQSFEIKVESDEKPIVEIDNQKLEFEKVHTGEGTYWVSYIDTRQLRVMPEDFLSEAPVKFLGFSKPSSSCMDSLKAFFH